MPDEMRDIDRILPYKTTIIGAQSERDKDEIWNDCIDHCKEILSKYDLIPKDLGVKNER